jgi:hypothetical protein
MPRSRRAAASGVARASACEHVFVTPQGGPYPRFRRALATGNPTLATAAAAELPRLGLGDALELVLIAVSRQQSS